MPTLVTITVPARHVKAGDLLHRPDGHMVSVTATYPTVKSVSVSYRGGDKPIKFDRADTATVDRMVETSGEVAAIVRAARLRGIECAIAEGPAEVKTQLAKHAAAPTNHRTFECYLRAATVADLWATVAAIAERDGQDLLTAVDTVIARETERILEQARSRTSRSTSVVANAIEDVGNDARATWIYWAKR